MKNKLWIASTLLIALGAFVGEAALAQERVQQPWIPTLTVTGQGEIQADPDQATVNLGAEAQAPTAQAAQAQVNIVMQRALQQIRAVGIEERRIQTSGLRLFPVYRQHQPGEPMPRDEGSPRITAYRATNTIRVEVHNLGLVGRVVDAGISSGANRIEGISFELQNDLPARTNALQRAVAEAQTKATTIAAALDMRLDGVSEVTEGGVNIHPPQPLSGMEFQRSAMATPVNPGQMDVRASVTVRYRLAPR